MPLSISLYIAIMVPIVCTLNKACSCFSSGQAKGRVLEIKIMQPEIVKGAAKQIIFKQAHVIMLFNACKQQYAKTVRILYNTVQQANE